jgi:hypothetical protein
MNLRKKVISIISSVIMLFAATFNVSAASAVSTTARTMKPLTTYGGHVYATGLDAYPCTLVNGTWVAGSTCITETYSKKIQGYATNNEYANCIIYAYFCEDGNFTSRTVTYGDVKIPSSDITITKTVRSGTQVVDRYVKVRIPDVVSGGSSLKYVAYYPNAAKKSNNVANWIVIKADDTVPTATYTLSTTAQTNQPVTINVTASDNVAVSSITLPDGTVESASTATYTASKNGNYDFIVTDTAGNTSTITATVSNIDTTAPTASYTLSTTEQTDQPVTINVTASDDVAVSSITLPDGTVEDASTATYTASVNGSYDFIVTDTAGNTSTVTATISNIDTTSNTDTTVSAES